MFTSQKGVRYIIDEWDLWGFISCEPRNSFWLNNSGLAFVVMSNDQLVTFKVITVFLSLGKHFLVHTLDKVFEHSIRYN